MRSIVHKARKDKRFAITKLTCVEDPRITATAKALHYYAVSRPDDWQWHMKDVLNRFKESKDAIYRAEKCLEKYGYMKRVAIRNDKGKIIDWEINWYEEPYKPLTGFPEVAEQEQAEQEQVKQEAAKPDAYYKPNSSSKRTNKKRTKGSYSDSAESGKKEVPPLYLKTGETIDEAAQALREAWEERAGMDPTISDGDLKKLLKPFFTPKPRTLDGIICVMDFYLGAYRDPDLCDGYRAKLCSLEMFLRYYDEVLNDGIKWSYIRLGVDD